MVDGQIAMHEDCCCEEEPGEPCTDCNGGVWEQPDAEITTSGDCPGDCPNVAGTVSPPGAGRWVETEDYCYYRWSRVISALNLYIVYCKGSGKMYAKIMGGGLFAGWMNFFGGNTIPDCYPPENSAWKEITGLVVCNKTSHHLQGAFDLDGLTEGPFPMGGLPGADLGTGSDDCTGCTAHVTLGG